MHRNFLIAAALLLALAVILGAFGAHGLKDVLTPKSLGVFETGVRYHFYHAFALLATGIVYERFRNRWTLYAGYCFIAGLLLFSGSLYLLSSLGEGGNVGLRKLGLVTPFGGLCFVAGWLLLMTGIITKKQPPLKPV